MPKTFSSNYFLPLCATVLAGSVFLGLTSQRQVVEDRKSVLAAKITKETSPYLRFDAKEPPVVSAKSVFVFEPDVNSVLYSKNSEEPILPASTTKIATAIVALSFYQLDTVLTVGKLATDGHKMDLVEGEKITVRDLLYGLLVFSANDAAEVLAQNYPGGRENFVLAMNNLAKSLGLKDTHFTNPVGFDEYLHFSTAQDLAKLASLAVKNQEFASFVATQAITVTSIDGKISHKLENINELLGKVSGVLGIKTGWTENSGESLITLVERDGKKIILALMGSQDRFAETEKIIDWVFTNYQWSS